MRGVPSILINREPVTCEFDAELIGDCTTGIKLLSQTLGFTPNEINLDEIEFCLPNKFILPGEYHPSFEEDGRSIFIVNESNDIPVFD